MTLHNYYNYWYVINNWKICFDTYRIFLYFNIAAIVKPFHRSLWIDHGWWKICVTVLQSVILRNTTSVVHCCLDLHIRNQKQQLSKKARIGLIYLVLRPHQNGTERDQMIHSALSRWEGHSIIFLDNVWECSHWSPALNILGRLRFFNWWPVGRIRNLIQYTAHSVHTAKNVRWAGISNRPQSDGAMIFK